MRSVSVRLADLERVTIPVGFEGENNYTHVNIDCKKIFDEDNSFVPTLALVSPEGEKYPGIVTRDGDIVTWVVSASDLTKRGAGELQLAFTKDDVIAKTYVARIRIERSITPDGEVPSAIENFIIEAGAIVNGIPQAIEDAIDDVMGDITAEAETLQPGSSASASFDSETKTFTFGIPTGEKGDSGSPGEPGEDGYSPSASVSKSGKVATISITDKDGTTTATISDGSDGSPGTPGKDGKDGTDGVDGFSPIATVSKAGKTATISITDKNGTTTASVSDGEDADPAELIDDTTPALNKTFSSSKLAADHSSLLNQINVLKPAATASDVGKFLKVKTVADGKPTAFEYGEGGGSGGTDDYNDLTNKPQIGGVTLVGNKSASDLGLLSGQDVTEAVDDYLEENFSNPSNPPLDRTLSSALSAAPADIVGTLRDKSDYVVSTSYTYPGNLADTTGVVKTGQYTDWVTFDFVGNGAYYTNPFKIKATSDASAQYEITFLDSNGTEITATKSTDQSTTTVIKPGHKGIVTINGTDLTLTYYLVNGNIQDVNYTLSAIPSKIKYRTRWWDSDKAEINGFTYNFSSETYVPYSAPVTVYSPNAEFADDVKDYFVENGFIDSTFDVSESAADAKAVGDELYDRKSITFETEGGWIRPADGTLISGSNYTATDYIPVTPGETIRVNRPALKEITDNAYYNASKQYVSGLTTPSNQMDLIIPSGVYYVRFSDSNSGFTGFSVERTGLWTRIRDAISESSGEAEYRNLIEQSKYGSNVLTLLHFSDLHMDATTMGFINTFRTRYAEFIDDVIQTGDVSNGFSNDWTTLVSVGLGDCLGVIGNHEALGDSKNSATQQQLYEKYIEPYISGWDVTQPTGVDDSTSEHYCANYYYKDYTSATIRLIVLDTQKWSSAQLSWFTDVLASARTSGYAVAVASHVLPGAITITDCNFSARYSAGNNVTHAFPTDDAPLASEDAVSAVNDFITAGGEFTIWIGGHEHADIFGVFTNYPNVTAYMIDKASIERETPGAARISGEKNQHAFNVMSIVRSGKQIKFVRIGEDVDGMMRGKHVFCYNYNTKTVISQW